MWRKGFRFHKNDRPLLGKPDMSILIFDRISC
ncbi:hypothetical protein NLX67_21350 [Domibacillus sp. A3M-37]|nr:hypothetical protein [Domibacillus sp. A3M-37]